MPSKAWLPNAATASFPLAAVTTLWPRFSSRSRCDLFGFGEGKAGVNGDVPADFEQANHWIDQSVTRLSSQTNALQAELAETRNLLLSIQSPQETPPQPSVKRNRMPRRRRTPTPEARSTQV
jgi:hypothetical protein